MDSYPKIESVVPLKQKVLLVTFVNGVTKLYDCKPILNEPPFKALRTDPIFDSVKVDLGGYGISWSDEIDLSEAELWMHGTPTEKPGGSFDEIASGI